MKPQGNTLRHKSGDGGRLGRELFGLFAIFCGLLIALSLATFDSRDPWLNHVVSGVSRIHNKAGLFGAYISGFFYDILGVASWVVPGFLCLAGARRILGAQEWAWWRWTGFALLSLCICIAGAASDLGDVEIFARGILPHGAGNVSTHGGGIIGHMLYVGMVGWLSSTGTFLIWLFSLLLAMQMLTGISWLSLLALAGRSSWQAVTGKTQDFLEKRAERKDSRHALALAGGPQTDMAQHHTVREQPPLNVTAYPLSAEPPVANHRPDESAVLSGSAEYMSPQTSVPPDHSRYDERVCISGQQESYVHPALLPPHDSQDADTEAEYAQQFEKEEEGLLPPLFHTANVQHVEPSAWTTRPGLPDKGDEEEDLPPWVRDFEQDRLGVRAESPMAWEEPHHAMTPELQVQETLHIQAHMENNLPENGGCEEHFAYSADQIPPFQAVPVDAREEEASFTPLLSPQTAAAVEALRAAGSATPALLVSEYEPVPEYEPENLETPPVIARQSPILQEEHAAAEEIESLQAAPVAEHTGNQAVDDGTNADNHPAGTPAGFHRSDDDIWQQSTTAPVSPAPLNGVSLDEAGHAEPPRPSSLPVSRFLETTPADPAEDTGYSGDIPIFEAQPVVMAPAPGVVEKVIQRFNKSARTPLPPLDLLQAAPASGGGTPREVLEAKGRSLMTCLSDFGIQGELVGITPGPVVTMFELRPAPGVRVSRIANLSDDLALALKAVAVRIQAPVPGTDTVGIEIPNEVRETVCLKELLSSQVFQQSKSLLTLALGKDIAGAPAVADLATMPHLLVAGATGAGKSVGINSIILSFIYKARPEEVKLLLVDPKRVEMAIYADLPHLVHPVVTEMQLAKNALEWAVAEMEQRYNAIAKAGVRNIADYNAKVAAWGDMPPPGMEDLAVIPYLVIVIDELADLMLVAAKEVETSIVRLAQLARAAGIHLILATQRPSVDVVTGLIKANFPCRISFQVTSKHDSRTILDTVGAEHLLGKGDMLFKPGGGKFKRMHGAFVSDQNVNAVVDYWKYHQRPDYQIDFADWSPEGSGGVLSGGNGGGGDIAADPMYNEAVEFVRQQGKASISLIQRKFRIGFNKAARFVEQMEMDGIIGPADGSKPRVVIR